MNGWGDVFRALVALVLALGVTSSLIILSIVEVGHDGHLTGEETTLLSTVLGAAIGALGAYIGLTAGEKNHARPKVQESLQDETPAD